MIDLGFVVNAEARPVTFLVKQGGGYSRDGDWIPEIDVSVDALATVQPVGAKDLRDLPEGLRVDAQYTIWTVTPIKIDDAMVFNGEEYRLVQVTHRPEGGFFRAIASAYSKVRP